MEIGRWLLYVVVNCVFVCIVAKTFSLNDLIEAESQQKRAVQTTTSTKLKESEPTAERFSLGLKPISRKLTEHKRIGNFIPLSKKTSPLKYRKTFQIKSPLKPKLVKNSLKFRRKSKNQSVKREANENVKLNRKYIPLLRSLSMLFDNILGADSSESFEVPQKRKRLRYYFEGDDDVPCKCSSKSSANADTQSEEKATSVEVLPTEVSVTEVTAQAPNNLTSGNVRSFRQNKIISVLLPRNTFGARRNDNGLSKRSRAAYNGSAERDISGDHGTSEYDPEWRHKESSSASDEESTSSNPRNRTSSVGFRGIRDRQPSNITETNYENDSAPKDEDKDTMDGAGGFISEFKGKDKLEICGDEAKSAELLPKPFRGLRGFLPTDKISDTSKSVQSKEDNEESHLNVTLDSSDDKRIIDRNGTTASEVQETSSGHETLMHQPEQVTPRPSKNKVPVVVIIDGYSVTRHRNGENKLSEKAINIHAK